MMIANNNRTAGLTCNYVDDLTNRRNHHVLDESIMEMVKNNNVWYWKDDWNSCQRQEDTDMLKLIEWRIIEANRLSYDFWNSRARNGEYFDWNQFKWLSNPSQVTKQYKYTGDYIERGKRGNQKFRATINPDDEVWFRYINKDIYELSLIHI